ncbi:MAG: IPExxxVDY family protein [Bacteroidales bacterium]|nr:IPExxxVDY family protein [Bacteroidales bacterium]
MAVKKHKLDMAIEEDFCLLGVVTDEPDYKLCWIINQSLRMNFEKQNDLKLFHSKIKEEQEFSNFLFEDEEAMITFRIIKNRTENGYYLEDLKNLDYLIHIQGEINTVKISNFMLSLGGLEPVRMCVPCDLSRIKNNERLLLW